MTVSQIINDFDDRHFNSFPAERKYRWVSELDLRIKAEIIDTHFPNDGERSLDGFTGYDPSRPDDVIIVPAAFGEMYEEYLCYRCDNANGEIERALNAGNNFNAIYDQYARWYHRTHKAKGPTVMR